MHIVDSAELDPVQVKNNYLDIGRFSYTVHCFCPDM